MNLPPATQEFESCCNPSQNRLLKKWSDKIEFYLEIKEHTNVIIKKIREGMSFLYIWESKNLIDHIPLKEE